MTGGGTLDGVTVTCANTLTEYFAGDLRQAFYNSGTGNSSCSALWVGASYLITAQKPNYVFTPASRTVSAGNIGGDFTGSPTIPISVQTSPSGLQITVDGAPYTSPQNFNWVAGSVHSISTSTVQAGSPRQQFSFLNWSDGGLVTHDVSPTVGTNYTANFATQYELTMNAGAGGTVAPAGGFFSSGQSVQITATPNNGFSFAGWTGSGTGSVTSSTNSVNVTMNGPITQTANFTQSTVQVTIQSSPAGRSITIDSEAPSIAPQIRTWVVGSSHAIGTTSTQAGSAGTQYVWTGWSDGGTISHNVTAPVTTTAYTANFDTQYQLTMTAGTGER